MSQELAPFAIGTERVPWEREPDRSVSRRQRLAARGPYSAAIPAQITTAPLDLPAGVLAEAEDAVREITRFDADVASIARHVADETGAPAELAPLASVLLRTESAASSQIEGVTAGARALALAAIDERAGVNARLVTANVRAMQAAVDLADEVSVGSLLAAHDALLHDHEHALPGRWRTSQVWIGSHAVSPHTATFVPPRHERVEGAMDDLIGFVRRPDLPVLPHVALAHAQFETIHPFVDGNGRVGRVLVHAMLRRADVTRLLTLPVSAGLLTDTAGYFDALGSFRAGDIEPIVRQFADASFRAVDNGRRLVADLETLLASWSERLSSRRGSAARRLLPLLLNQPAVDVAHVVGALGVAPSAAQRAVEQLESAEIVSRVGSARRNRVWLAAEVVDALDAFAARVGRRG